MDVAVGDRVVAKKIFHGREKHQEPFINNFIPPWSP